MEAPNCRTCGNRHYGPCNVFYNAEEPKKEKAVDMQPDKTVVRATGSKHGVYADKEKRKAYRREYMKKRRAKA
jgi:hypothetical protein